MSKGKTVQEQKQIIITPSLRVPQEGYRRLLQLVGNDERIADEIISEYFIGNLFNWITPSDPGYDSHCVGWVISRAAELAKKQKEDAIKA